LTFILEGEGCEARRLLRNPHQTSRQKREVRIYGRWASQEDRAPNPGEIYRRSPSRRSGPSRLSTRVEIRNDSKRSETKRNSSLFISLEPSPRTRCHVDQRPQDPLNPGSLQHRLRVRYQASQPTPGRVYGPAGCRTFRNRSFDRFSTRSSSVECPLRRKPVNLLIL